MTNRKRRTDSATKPVASMDARQRTRRRPTPRWLMSSSELDAIAQRRCLLVLSVLSGELPVSDAIAQMQISRGMYYQLETKALHAMVAALTPGASDEERGSGTLTGKISALEEKVKRLEQEKRRSERLVLLTKKMLASGPVKTASGRPQGSRSRKQRRTPMTSSTTPVSPTSPSTSSATPPSSKTESAPSSTLTRDGATAS